MNMQTKLRAHYTALTELVELMSIASLIALVADAIWVVRDMIVSGATPTLYLVATLLYIALILMSKAVYKYHIKSVRKILLLNGQITKRLDKTNTIN